MLEVSRVYTYKYKHIYVYMQMRIYVYICVRTYVYIYLRTYVHTHIGTSSTTMSAQRDNFDNRVAKWSQVLRRS